MTTSRCPHPLTCRSFWLSTLRSNAICGDERSLLCGAVAAAVVVVSAEATAPRQPASSSHASRSPPPTSFMTSAVLLADVVISRGAEDLRVEEIAGGDPPTNSLLLLPRLRSRAAGGDPPTNSLLLLPRLRSRTAGACKDLACGEVGSGPPTAI